MKLVFPTYLSYRQFPPNMGLSKYPASVILPPCLNYPGSLCRWWGTPRAAVPAELKISWQNYGFVSSNYFVCQLFALLTNFAVSLVLLLSLQLRNILNRMSHSEWISSASLWCFEVRITSPQMKTELKELLKPKLPHLLTQNPCREGHHDVCLSLSWSVSPQASLSQRDARCRKLFACMDGELFHSLSQMRGHLTSVFTGDQEM